MCRLFGFRSVIPSQVHRSLVEADNALGRQSDAHRDGWGVAFYVDGSPHVTRSPATALNDHLFHRLSGVVSSETVVAHVRRATVGGTGVLNCHPFQYGRWTFAHNGEIPEFHRHRESLLKEVAPRLRRFILGDTDSEVIFFILLTRLSAGAPLHHRQGVEEVMAATEWTVARIREICDPGSNAAPDDRCYLTLLVTDGPTLVATHGGKELRWSTYKSRCVDRDTCPSLAPECEAATLTGFVNHLILSSEEVAGDNIWQEMIPGEIIGVDWRMRLVRKGHVEEEAA